MITGLGVDIVEIDRMKLALERTPRIKERIFSAEERSYCDKRAKPEVHYALRFAAKEAVLKALGSGFSGMRFTDVEVVREAGGRPVPRLYGRAAELAEENGIIEMHLSLSFTHSTAVASAVAITQERRPKKDERLDPKAELAALFKQARTLLDEVDVADERAADGPAVVVEGNTEL
ncbi:MAG: holo-ACP synthase [Actinomycetota bacterium]|jgi:holo-[acyl-carrier protein] synthase|nr:holo-ACP synthase [Actinomycetota bacterium]